MWWRSWLWRSLFPPPPLLAPADYRSRDEKIGITPEPGAVTDGPGHTWAWVRGQFEGAKFWGKSSRLVRVRRRSWPVAVIPKGFVFPATGDGQYVSSEEDKWVWHIWRPDDVGDQSTFVGGLCKGWGGQLGAQLDDDDFVMVCGVRERDGTMYRPSADDLSANDWERLP